MGKARKNLGLGLCCVSFLFLFNPTISVIDVLPDFLGYLLLCIGITQLADMNDHFAASLQCFKKMLIAAIVQFLSIFLLFGLVTGRERPTAFLLFSFVFATIELIFLTRAFAEFFEGFLYLGSRMDAKSVFRISASAQAHYESRCQKEVLRTEKKNRKRMTRGLSTRVPREIRPPKNATVSAAHVTLFFIIAKVLLTVLPEFASLTMSSYDDANRFSFLYQFVNLFRTFAIFFGIPIGIFWCVKVICYVRSILKDTPFINALRNKYTTEVEPKTYLFIQRAVRLAFVFMSAGFFFSTDIYMESNTINILPDVFSAICILVSLVLLRKFVKIPVYSYALCGAYGGFSVFTYITSSRFFTDHTLTLTDIRWESYEAFQQLKVVEIADSILFFSMIVSVLPVLAAVIDQYTGFSPVSGNNIHSEDKIRYVHSTLKKRLLVMSILATLCLVSGVCYILLLKVANFMWILDFLACMILAVYSLLSLNHITQEVEYKYMLA